MSLTITATNKADLLAQVADLTGATPGTGTGTGTGTGGTAPPPPPSVDPRDPTYWDDTQVQAKFFPVDFTKALFPSPDRTIIAVDPDGTLHGPAYILDAQGGRWKFDLGADGKSIKIDTKGNGYGYQISVNGLLIKDSSGNNFPSMPATRLMISQGQVYWQAFGGQIQKTQALDVPNSGNANTSLPPFWTDPFFGYKQSVGLASGGTMGSGGGSAGGVPAKQDPPAQSVAYGSTGKTILFGPDQAIKGPTAACAVAKAGDIVKASDAARGQVFKESFDVPDCVVLDLNAPGWLNIATAWAALKAGDVTGFRAQWVEGAVIDGAGVPQSAYSHGLGGVVIVGNGKVINGHIRNWQPFTTPQHDGSAGLRFKGSAVGKFTGNNLFIEGCQNGIGPGGTVVQTDVSKTILYNNTGRDGGAHNIYNTTSCSKDWYGPDFYSWVDAAPAGESGGHALKTRASVTTLVGPIELYSADATPLDIADGSSATIKVPSGVRLIKKAGDSNHNIVSYAVENGGVNGKVGMQFQAGAIVDAPTGLCGFLTTGPITFDAGVQFPQGKPTLDLSASGGSLTGVPGGAGN